MGPLAKRDPNVRVTVGDPLRIRPELFKTPTITQAGRPGTIQYRLLQGVLDLGAKMRHERLQRMRERPVFGERDRSADGVEDAARCIVIDRQPPRAPAINDGNPSATEVVHRRGVPGAGILDENRTRLCTHLHIPRNRRGYIDPIGRPTWISWITMRPGDDPGTRVIFIHVGQIPDHDETHGNIRKRLPDTPRILARVSSAVGRQVVRPVRVPFAGIRTPTKSSGAEPAGRAVHIRSNRTKMQLCDSQMIVEHLPRDTDGDRVCEVLRQPNDVVDQLRRDAAPSCGPKFRREIGGVAV